MRDPWRDPYTDGVPIEPLYRLDGNVFAKPLLGELLGGAMQTVAQQSEERAHGAMLDSAAPRFEVIFQGVQPGSTPTAGRIAGGW